jgi:hypothetical protein
MPSCILDPFQAIDKLEEMLDGGMTKSKFGRDEYIGIYTYVFSSGTEEELDRRMSRELWHFESLHQQDLLTLAFWI